MDDRLRDELNPDTNAPESEQDRDALAHAALEEFLAEEAVKEAEAAAEGAAEEEFQVTVKVIVEKDELEASVLVVPPVPILPQLIREALAAEGVLYGLDEEAIMQVAVEPPAEPVKVAVGMPAENGRDASVSYFFRVDASKKGKPLELDDGRVDLRELGTIENFDKGKILATKNPPTEGTPGRNVRDSEIPAKAGKDLALRNGPNTILTDDGMHIVAGIDGQPVLDAGRVAMNPVIVVPKNVDYSNGNIDFHGSVKIGADVLPGFTVKATQDIEVSGMVEGAILEAGGKITCRGGVRQQATLNARGEVAVRFVDSSSSITTWANLIVAESALHSNLTAGLAIKIGKKLIGGYAQAGEYVSAEQIGTHSGTVTHVDVRRNSQAKVIQQLQRAIENLSGQRASVSEAYDTLGRDPDAPKEVMEKTRELLDQLEDRLAEMQAELTERLHAPKQSNRAVFVASRDGFFPGLHAHFDEAFQHIDTFTPVQRLTEVNGAVVMT